MFIVKILLKTQKVSTNRVQNVKTCGTYGNHCALKDKYGVFLISINEFTALRFTGTCAPPNAGRMRILPMNQPITFGMKKVINVWTA
jgi:hypothetical protein